MMDDAGHHKTLARLIGRIGSQEEYLRLGFLATDDTPALLLSSAGLGYFIDVAPNPHILLLYCWLARSFRGSFGETEYKVR